ncbi:AraC family transcriptional regulator [Rhodoferax sp.]|uniref:AraC family transcriptional regulator n=1 Tax=Rhodoferax sp. TaxID=50421 RepID=UPI00374C9EEB
MDLSPLVRRCVFRSNARVDTHDQVAAEFSDHGLTWNRGKVDTALCKTTVRQLQVFMLQYGAEVEIRPRPFDDFVLVHMSLAGTADIESDGRRVHLRPGAAAVLAPRHNLHMRWQQGSRQFILKVPRALMRGDGSDLDYAIGPSVQQLSDMQGLQWQFLMQSLLHATNLPGDNPAHAVWVEHLERNVALFLASRPDATPARAANDAPDLSSAGDLRRLDLLDSYMRSRLCAPIALEDLAQAAGVSVRSLNMLCQRHHAQSPMVLLRNMRLDAVRTRLVAQPGGSVTDLAFEYGFGHLGRFSGYYRERFGELPRQTGGVHLAAVDSSFARNG